MKLRGRKDYVRTLLRLARDIGIERSIALITRDRRKALATIERLKGRVA